jgi:Na+-transporting methylmalonyl-CoA/oxaloacetate decarboxylase beta subunit
VSQQKALPRLRATTWLVLGVGCLGFWLGVAAIFGAPELLLPASAAMILSGVAVIPLYRESQKPDHPE